MKRTISILLCAAALAAASSCTLEDILGINLDYDMNDPWSSWEKVKPGVYLGTDKDYNKGDVIAKGTDGSIINCNVETSSDVPQDFCGFDADHTSYTFSYDSSKGNKFLTCTKSVYSDEKGSSLGTFATDVTSQKKLWASKGAGIITTPKKYKKVANGGSFLDNYKVICQKYQALPYQAPDDQIVIDHTEYLCNWLSKLYPAEMNSRNWVVPYTGKGKIESMTVNRQYGWDKVGERKVLWGGCHWENVTYVKATITGLDYEDAAAYISKVKGLAKYNKVIDEGSDGKSFITFNVYSDDSTESTEGYSGYIYPGYKISYTELLYKQMTIEFSVCYVTYV